MAGSYKKKKPYGKMLITGVIAAIMYALLLTNQSTVSDYFTRGGVFALLPILTALVFSLVHGSFTSNFWTVLGVEASKKKKEVK